MRIMIVDDEIDIQPLFNQKFKNEIRNGRVELVYCFSAEDALAHLESVGSTEFVLILSDINMPGMNGIELLKVLKQKYPHLKVFMITAYDDEEKYQKAVQFGADNYLTKPLDFDKLKKDLNISE